MGASQGSSNGEQPSKRVSVWNWGLAGWVLLCDLIFIVPAVLADKLLHWNHDVTGAIAVVLGTIMGSVIYSKRHRSRSA